MEHSPELDAFGTTLRSVTINVNDRCPLSCRHCSIGYSPHARGSGYVISEEDLMQRVGAIPADLYDMVLLAGGEPSLEAALLRKAIDFIARTDLLSGLVTAPLWGKTLESAKSFLSLLKGLKVLILSFDQFHLEFLTTRHYYNAILAAAELGLPVTLHMTFTDETDLGKLRVLAAEFPPSFYINQTRVIPAGNAARLAITQSTDVLVSTACDLDRIPRSCVLGNALIADDGSIHGCCWARLVPASPLSIVPGGLTIGETFRALEDREAFQRVRRSGFLDSLSVKERARILKLFAGRAFSSECQLCLSTMRECAGELWSERKTN